MEGETIKKKYMTILDMLKKERLTFGNQIEGLEAQLVSCISSEYWRKDEKATIVLSDIT